MVHFSKLIALLSVLFSSSFALSVEYTSSGRSPTALQDEDATPEWNSPVIDFAPPAPKRALLVTRGDNMEKSLQFIKEAMDMAKNKNKSAKEFKEFIDQGRVTIGKLGDEIQREKQAAQSSRPAGKHTWPKPGDRLNLEGSNHYENPPSTSYDKTLQP
ncbi:hypothetical protein CF327_g7122 [Tilletia walkeri]|nr:hypothetical protein CF327_g7122 [Tilletia walkeri]